MKGMSVRRLNTLRSPARLEQYTLTFKKIGVRRGKFYPGSRHDLSEGSNSASHQSYCDNVALLRSYIVPFIGVVKGGLA